MDSTELTETLPGRPRAIKEGSAADEIMAIRDKWIISTTPDKVCLNDTYQRINERGYAPRLDCLTSVDGPVISVGSADRALSLFSALVDPKGGILMDLNPYFTEVGLPYYAEAILVSRGNLTRIYDFFKKNGALLLGLYKLAYEKYSKKPPLSPFLPHSSYNEENFLRGFIQSRANNQSYLGKHSWTESEQRLTKLFELVKEGAIRGYTADVTDSDAWKKAFGAFQDMGVQDEVGVIDISNVHGSKWAEFSQGDLRDALCQVFPIEGDEPIVLGSGTITCRKPSVSVLPQPGKISLSERYRHDPVLEPYYKNERWGGDNPPLGAGPIAWISRGIWPFIEEKSD